MVIVSHDKSPNLLTCTDIFGKNNAFRKWKGDKYDARMNRAIFDIFAYYFSVFKNEQLFLKKANLIKENFNKLCIENGDFLKSISSNTNNIIETSTRFVLWGQALQSFNRSMPGRLK